MLLCDLTLPTPEENLACDEALIEACERGDIQAVLRFWEPAQYFVVLGYANKAKTEADLGFCQQNRVPVLRRCSGGGAVLQGPGCLNYSLILGIDCDPALASISGTNDFVLSRHRTALTLALGAPVEREGHTDLAIGGVKFSGNAQRRRQRFLLFHGSFLLGLDIGLVQRALPMPSKQPDYRANRPHSAFLANLNVSSRVIKMAIAQAWKAKQEPGEMPMAAIRSLATGKYSSPEWNFRF